MSERNDGAESKRNAGHDSDPPIRVELQIPPEDALAKLADAFRSREARGLSIDLILKIVPLLTVVGAAVTTLAYFRSDWQQRQQQIKLSQSQIDLALLELKAKNRLTGTLETTLSVAPTVPDATYAVRFGLSVPNKAETQMQVNANLIEVFVGTEHRERLDGGVVGAVRAPLGEDEPAVRPRLELPPSGIPLQTPAFVDWAVIARDQFEIRDKVPEGNVGTLRPGESSSGTYDYSIRAAPGQWVAVRARVQLQLAPDNSGKAGTSIYVSELYCQLDTGGPWGCPPPERKDAGSKVLDRDASTR